MSKILTIIIPTYNMEKYLRKCLDSLIISDENMHFLEVLVVNDGSKDSSSAIGHKYEERYPQTFRVIDKENGNYGSCVNRGLKEATGKYVKILDADDYFDNDVFNRYICYLDKVDADLVISDFDIVDESGKVTEKCSFHLPTIKNFSLDTLDSHTVEWLWHHAICYRTANVKKINYVQTEGISYTDDEWIFKPMVTVDSISYFSEPLYCYLRGREGQTFDPKVLKKTYDQRVVVAKSMTEYYVNIEVTLPGKVKAFLTKKLQSRIKGIYRFCLITNNSMELNRMLIQFDQYLKATSLEVYELTDIITNDYGWKFVRSWRQSGYRTTLLLNVMRIKQLLKPSK